MSGVSSRLNIVYHCFCSGEWESIVNEHFQLVSHQRVFCSMIGTILQQEILESIADRHSILIEILRFEEPNTYEHEAMKIIELKAVQSPKDYTLYFHTKGASDNSLVNISWRNYMNAVLIKQYNLRWTQLMDSKKDVTGCLYVSMKKDVELGGISTNFFAGNFWIASNEYIRQLPSYQDLRIEFGNDRFLAERYIGWDNPLVLLLDQEFEYTTSTGKKNNVAKRIYELIDPIKD